MTRPNNMHISRCTEDRVVNKFHSICSHSFINISLFLFCTYTFNVTNVSFAGDNIFNRSDKYLILQNVLSWYYNPIWSVYRWISWHLDTCSVRILTSSNPLVLLCCTYETNEADTADRFYFKEKKSNHNLYCPKYF